MIQLASGHNHSAPPATACSRTNMVQGQHAEGSAWCKDSMLKEQHGVRTACARTNMAYGQVAQAQHGVRTAWSRPTWCKNSLLAAGTSMAGTKDTCHQLEFDLRLTSSGKARLLGRCRSLTEASVGILSRILCTSCFSFFCFHSFFHHNGVCSGARCSSACACPCAGTAHRIIQHGCAPGHVSRLS